MGYRNAFDFNGQNQKSGELAENIFESLAKKRGLKIKQATKSQQFSHIDFILTDKKDQNHFFDVKARKKTSRTSSNYSDDLVWIEFKNVSGNNGWIYGSADFIAFERDSDFVITPRKLLADLCERIVNRTKKVEKSSEALYSLYTRKDRKDELSMIKMEDILNNIKVSIWKKNECNG